MSKTVRAPGLLSHPQPCATALVTWFPRSPVTRQEDLCALLAKGNISA